MTDGPYIRAVDVHVSFGDVLALNGASLSIDSGTIYALLGRNGAGKTTLINVLSTLVVPDSGVAFVGPEDVVKNPTEVRARIGLAGQFAAVDDFLTGRENVEMVGELYGLRRSEARRRAAEVLERFDLTGAADRPTSGYSGGMRRRLDLAASLVGRPEVLFLDEPSTGIDPTSRLDIWHLIRELVEDRTTILLTTQYLEEADQLAERIGVIDHGVVVSEGTSDELKDSLGQNRLRLRVHDQDQDATRRVVSQIPAVTEPSPGVFDFATSAGGESLLSIVRRLDAAGIEPVTLALERPTLDDVFARLTGGDRSEGGEA